MEKDWFSHRVDKSRNFVINLEKHHGQHTGMSLLSCIRHPNITWKLHLVLRRMGVKLATARVCELSDKYPGEPASGLDATTPSSPAMKYTRAVYFGIQTLDKSAEMKWSNASSVNSSSRSYFKRLDQFFVWIGFKMEPLPAFSTVSKCRLWFGPNDYSDAKMFRRTEKML